MVEITSTGAALDGGLHIDLSTSSAPAVPTRESITLDKESSPAVWHSFLAHLNHTLAGRPSELGSRLAALPAPFNDAVYALLKRAGDPSSAELTSKHGERRDPLWLVGLNSLPRIVLHNPSDRQVEFRFPDSLARGADLGGRDLGRIEKLRASFARAGVTPTTVVMGVDLPYTALIRPGGGAAPHFCLYDSARDVAYFTLGFLDEIRAGVAEDEALIDHSTRKLTRSQPSYSLLDQRYTHVANVIPYIVEELRLTNLAMSDREWIEESKRLPAFQSRVDELESIDHKLRSNYVAPRIDSLNRQITEIRGTLGQHTEILYDDRNEYGALANVYAELILLYDRLGLRNEVQSAYENRIEALVNCQRANPEGILPTYMQLQKIHAFLWSGQYGDFLLALGALLECPFGNLAGSRPGFPVDLTPIDKLTLFGNLHSWSKFLERQCLTVLRRREWELPVEERTNIIRIIRSVEERFGELGWKNETHAAIEKYLLDPNHFAPALSGCKISAQKHEPGEIICTASHPAGGSINIQCKFGIGRGFVKLWGAEAATDNETRLMLAHAVRKVADLLVTNFPLDKLDLLPIPPLRKTLPFDVIGQDDANL